MWRGGKAVLPLDSLVWRNMVAAVSVWTPLGEDGRGVSGPTEEGGWEAVFILAGWAPSVGCFLADGTEEVPGEAPGLGQVCGPPPRTV